MSKETQEQVAEATHSPLPWGTAIRADTHKLVVVAADNTFVCALDKLSEQVTNRKDAALIVRAVNSHAALVEALEGFLHCGDTRPDGRCSYTIARAALALAKGGE